jgi:hypothetical protein
LEAIRLSTNKGKQMQSRRSFLKVLGVGGVAVAIPTKLLVDNSFEGKLNQLVHEIATDKIHSLDGTLMLKDFKEADKPRFTKGIKANKDFNKVVKRCSKYVIDGGGWGEAEDQKNYDLYQKLSKKRGQTPIAKRPRPDFRRGIV